MPIRRVLASLLAGAAAGGAALLAYGCASANPDYDASRPHHRPTGFQNNHIEFRPKNFLTDVLLGWRLPSAIKGLPPPPQTEPPVVRPDLMFLRANALAGATMQPAVTFIGHASTLVQMPTPEGGLNLLTDPIFSERASPVPFAGPKRHQPPGVSLADLPRIDLVIISHNHYDHLDEPSVRALAAQPGGSPLFVVPLGLKAWMEKRGITRVVELDWWQHHKLKGAEVWLTPVQHWSARGLGDALATLWGGYAVLSPQFHLYFSGDTGYSKDFATTRERFADRQTPALGGGFDLALIAVGAYEPRWFMRDQHLNPQEAVQVHMDLAAKRSIGIHWGTFELTDEALDQPPRDLAAARIARGLPQADFDVLAIGQTLKLPRRQ